MLWRLITTSTSRTKRHPRHSGFFRRTTVCSFAHGGEEGRKKIGVTAPGRMCVFVLRSALNKGKICDKFNKCWPFSFSLPHQMALPVFITLFLAFSFYSFPWMWHFDLVFPDEGPLTAPLKTQLGSHCCVGGQHSVFPNFKFKLKMEFGFGNGFGITTWCGEVFNLVSIYQKKVE